jgi:hypothetical protein
MSNLPNQIFIQYWLGLKKGSSKDFLRFSLLGQTCMKLSTCLWKQLKFSIVNGRTNLLNVNIDIYFFFSYGVPLKL